MVKLFVKKISITSGWYFLINNVIAYIFLVQIVWGSLHSISIDSVAQII